jgi:hypothetical protein
MNEVIYKIRVNRPCCLFIDDELPSPSPVTQRLKLMLSHRTPKLSANNSY